MRDIKTKAPLVIQRRRFVFIYFIYQRMAGQGRLNYYSDALLYAGDRIKMKNSCYTVLRFGRF